MTALDNKLLDLFPQAKLIRLKGYSNGNTDYAKAKTPTDKWKDAPGLSREEAKACLDQNGWLGVVIPEGYILIDVDNKQTGRAIHEAVSGKLQCISIETPNGSQFFFKDTGKVERQRAKMLTVGGLVVDYRTANNGYIVLPTENTEYRKVVYENDGNLDDMPLMFIPARGVNENDATLQIPIHEGSRNDTLFRDVASRVKGLNETHRLGLTDDERLKVMQEINEYFCDPPLPSREIEAIFKSTERYESTPLPAINEKKVFDLDNLFIDAAEFLDSDYNSDDYLQVIEGILPEGSLVALSAPPSNYKTFLSINMAVGVSSGKPVLERETTQKTVIYIDLENPQSILHKRLKMLAKHGVSGLKLWTRFSSKEPPPFPDDVYIDIARKYEKPVMIFDSFIRFLPRGADENSAKDMAPVMGFLRKLTSCGATVLLLHHSGKKDGSELRGSSDILAGVDIAYMLVKDAPGRITMKCIKNRYAQEETLIIGISEDEEGYLSFNDLSAQERDLRIMEQEMEYKKLQGIISFLEKEGIEANQSRIIKEANEKFALTAKKTTDLLQKGTRKYWSLKKTNGNHKVYTVEHFGFSTPLYDEKLKSSEDIQNISQTVTEDPDFPHEEEEDIPLIDAEVSISPEAA